jgi:agmatine deiminase
MIKRRHTLLTGAAAMALAPRTGSAALPSGYVVPPEEAPHQRTFMQWPVNREVHSDPVFLDMVQDTIAEIANTIAAFEPVTMLAHPADHARARRKLTAGVELWDIPTEDLWCRDAGPLFVINGQGGIAISHLNFNGWGRKQIHARDSQIAPRVAERLGLPLIGSGLQGEAGGVKQDGHGLLIAHESSWVIENRNPGLRRDEVEKRLLSAYGANRIIWAPGVWDQDITDYHIDSLARFTGPGRVLMQLPDDPDPSDDFHMAALETHDILEAAGMQIEVIPEPVERRVEAEDFVAAYVNYYVCNGAVISAQFGDREADAIALEALRCAYPGREMVTLNADTLGEMGGGIHCATQQMPRV